MTARDLKEWFNGLTEEELDMFVFAGRTEDGEYNAVESAAICATADDEEMPRAIFLD